MYILKAYPADLSAALAPRQVTEEEKKKMEAQHKMEDGTKRVVNKLMSRRKLKKTYEYEVEWKNSSPDQNTWIPRDKCAPSLHLSLPAHTASSLPVRMPPGFGCTPGPHQLGFL